MASSRVHLVIYQVNKCTREEKVVHNVAAILACIPCTLPTDMMGNRDRTVSQHDNTERREVVDSWIVGAKSLILHFRKRSSRALDVAKSFDRLATSSDSNRSDRVAAHAQASLREIYGHLSCIALGCSEPTSCYEHRWIAEYGGVTGQGLWCGVMAGIDTVVS